MGSGFDPWQIDARPPAPGLPVNIRRRSEESWQIPALNMVERRSVAQDVTTQHLAAVVLHLRVGCGVLCGASRLGPVERGPILMLTGKSANGSFERARRRQFDSGTSK